MGHLTDAFGVIRLKEESGHPIKASDWRVTVTEQAHHAYKVTDFKSDIDQSSKGTVTFVLEQDSTTSVTLVGAIEADGSNPITLDGKAVANPSMDAGFAGHVSIIPPRVSTSMILNFFFTDPAGTTQDHYRMETNIGSTHIPGVPTI